MGSIVSLGVRREKAVRIETMNSKMLRVWLVFLLLVSPLLLGAGPPKPQGKPLPLDTFESRAREAIANGEEWPKASLLVALKLVGESCECSSRVIELRSKPESFDGATIIITDQGYLDDSVRGERYELVLERGPGGVWRVLKATNTWNCYRGHEEFSTELCN